LSERLASRKDVVVIQERAGQIVAMGGGGFSMEPENRLLDDFVLSLAKQQPARISTHMAPGLAFPEPSRK